MLATLGWVTAAAALVLAAVGSLPARFGGDTREVRRAASLEDAERRLGARLLLPAYFPERLEWPPAQVRVAGGKGGSAALLFRSRGVRDDQPVELLQASSPAGAIDPELLGDRRVRGSSRTTVGSRPASIAEVLRDGWTWRELSFEVDGRSVLLRSKGDVDELYRMARSVHLGGR
jgi:hypothetical protein